MRLAVPAHPRAVVVYKRSALALGGGPRGAGVRALPPTARAALRDSHAAHQAGLREVLAALAEAGIEVTARFRSDVRRRLRGDLVVTVGGDGTLLDAARWVRDELVLAVNSAPGYSVGVFTGADARTVAARVRDWRAGRLRPTPLPRMRVTVNGRPIRWPVLNDVLFAHRNPAAMTRYRIRVRGREEDHRSSGLYIATGPGSTGAIRSAGGRILPIRSRLLQFLAREPYAALGPRPRLARGCVGPEGLLVTCLTRDTALFCDGSHRVIPLRPGDRVRFTIDGPPLRVLGLDPRRRRIPWAQKR